MQLSIQSAQSNGLEIKISGQEDWVESLKKQFPSPQASKSLCKGSLLWKQEADTFLWLRGQLQFHLNVDCTRCGTNLDYIFDLDIAQPFTTQVESHDVDSIDISTEFAEEIDSDSLDLQQFIFDTAMLNTPHQTHDLAPHSCLTSQSESSEASKVHADSNSSNPFSVLAQLKNSQKH